MPKIPSNLRRQKIVVPVLEHHCGSWVVSRKDGSVIGEFFSRKNVELFNGETCIAETTLQYLCRINQEIKECDA